MKKLLTIIIICLFLFGCETQEERDKRKKEEEIKKVTEEIEKQEVPKETKEWLVNIKTDKVITVFCFKTSKKCETLKTTIEDIKKEYDLITYIIYFDEIEDASKEIYKTTYKLDDYTGYLPYIMITNKEKLVSTHTDTLNKEDFVKYLEENKIISVVSTTKN